MNQELLFFFSALGAFNGVLLGFYFIFISKPKHTSSILLGCLFWALSFRVGKSIFFYFYDYIADVYIQFGLFACWLIGPFLYFYVKSAINYTATIKKEAGITLVSLASFAIVLNLLFSWSAYPDFWYYFIRVIYLQWFAFVVLSGGYLYKHRQLWFENKRNKPFKIWLLSIYFGNFLICLAFNTGNYTSYIVGALSFSVVFYLLIVLLIYYKRRDELIFLETKKYKRNKINEEEARAISHQLQDIIENEQLFLDSNLSLQKLSKRLQVSTVKISQTLNEYSNTTFNDYINGYRIAEAKEMIKNGSPLTLEAISMDCGFNSKSTFYSAFRKQTGMTPSKFRSQFV
ncbi:MAG: helix-turn-helix domain-containing protein [Bacteroidota bacterium]